MFQELSIAYINEITRLTCFLNPSLSFETLLARQKEMFEFSNYQCFGWFEKEILIGVASGWITMRLYSGRQLEIDNVIFNPDFQSKGLGALFIVQIENWASSKSCETVELNTYVNNSRSHKFYFRHKYEILGFHFQKRISK
tara:strand:+ start:181719 stop:182141 length:423 start_codon:yes stop_codon:yes gene_type:complete